MPERDGVDWHGGAGRSQRLGQPQTYTVTKMAGVLMHKLTRGDISPEQTRAHVVAEVKAYNSTQPDEPWEEVLPSALVQNMRESITGKKKAT